MRYLRLYLHFLRFSFSRAMEFRLDFYFRVVMDVIYYMVHLGFFTVIYRHTDLLGGWNEAQIYVFICGAMVVDALHMTVFANNLWWLPTFINRGDLDYYLTRPVSSLYLLSLRDFAANSFLNLIIASSLLAWALGRYPTALSAGRILLYLALLVVGTLVYYLIRMLFIIPAFWLQSSRGLDELSWSFYRLAERPHQIYHDWVRLMMLTVLPMAFAFSVPAHVLFDGPGWRILLHTLAVSGGLFGFVVWFWGRGLRAYASASS